MTNTEVIKAFLEHKRGQAAGLSTDGQRLLSYGWYEIARWYPIPFKLDTSPKLKLKLCGKDAHGQTWFLAIRTMVFHVFRVNCAAPHLAVNATKLSN